MNDRIRIAMLAAMPYPTRQGTQVFTAHLMHALSTSGYSLRLLAYPYGAPSVKQATPPRDGWGKSLRSGPQTEKLLLDTKLLHTALGQIRQWHPHLLWAHNYEALLLGIILRAVSAVPLLYHAHNIMTDELPTYAASRAKKFFARLTGSALDRLPAKADSLIVFDQRHRDWLTTHGARRERFHIIPAGLLAEDPPALAPARSSSLHQLRLPADPFILYCGNLDSYQNLDLLAQAMPLVWRSAADVKLVILTASPPHRVYGWASRHKLDPSCIIARRLSAADQLQAFLRACRAMVVPRTVWWGFPIKIISALQTGTVIVGTISSLGDHLDKQHAILCKADPISFASGIRAALDEENRGRLAREGRDLYHRRFDLTAQLPLYHRAIEMTARSSS